MDTNEGCKSRDCVCDLCDKKSAFENVEQQVFNEPETCCKNVAKIGRYKNYFEWSLRNAKMTKIFAKRRKKSVFGTFGIFEIIGTFFLLKIEIQ